MRNILVIFVFLVMSSCIQEEDKRIHITGELPIIQDSYAKMFIEEDGKRVLYKTALKDGKFDLYFDSLEKGIYKVIIEWPWPFEKRYMTYRDKGGKVVRKYSPQIIHFIVLSKELYINPEQSLSYYITSEKEITDQMIQNFDPADYKRTDRFRLKAVSDAEDTQLFERLDSLKRYFTGLSMYLVFDSLYRNSKRPDKIEQDFSSLATKINFEKNYPAYLESRKEIIKHHLDNPIAAMNLLDVDKDYFIANIEEYENLVNRMGRRAKDSPYYNRLRLKIDGLKDPFTEGKVLPLPVGNTPDTFQYSNRSGRACGHKRYRT